MKRPLVISILAKSKAHILPTYLQSLLNQTEISSNTIFYIRTNDNRDNTDQILRDWYQKWNWKYRMVFDDSSIDHSLINIENHDWSNTKRFKILGKIRQDSIDFAKSEGADYFVADADNLIKSNTIQALRSVNLPVVAPLLHAHPNSLYSNFHSSIDENGYFKNDNEYNQLYARIFKGLIEVPVVHCTYFIKNEVLPFIVYDDESHRFEYVIFSDSLRKAGIPQYLDTREIYGRISFAVDMSSYEEDLKLEVFRNLIQEIKNN